MVLPKEASMIGLAKRAETEVRILDGAIVRRQIRPTRRCEVEIGVLEQYLSLELAQTRRRHDAQLVIKHGPSCPVGPQRGPPPPARPVEREHV